MENRTYSDFIFYNGMDGKISVQLIMGANTVWTTESGIAEIFGVDRSGIARHIKNIFEQGEVPIDSNVQKMHIANSSKPVSFYSLDVIIATGYRVNSYKATKFRIWSNQITSEYLTKGFVLDSERLKQANNLFGRDYFSELLERIKEIRASEKMFYEKIKDLYSTSVDYDKNDPEAHKFFAKVQNKVEFAIVKKTSAETIKSKANYLMPNMGLKTWKNIKKDGKIQKSDISIAKNYFNEDEIRRLNSLVNMYLDYASLQIERNKVMKMIDWDKKLDNFLTFNEFPVLNNSGSVSKDDANKFAENEYSKFKVIEDNNYRSSFDKVATDFITTGKIPTENESLNQTKKTLTEVTNDLIKEGKVRIPSLKDVQNKDSDFNLKLKGLLSVPPPKKDRE